MSPNAKQAFRRIGAAAALLLAPGVQAPVQAQDTPYLGQFMYVGFNFPPKGFAFCNGQILPINQNQALFSLMGTTYGGNGQTTFALPNMQGRVPVHMGQGPGLSFYTLGQTGGAELVTLNGNNLPAHVHSVSVTAQIPADSGNASSAVPTGNNLANSVHTLNYSASAPNVSLSSTVSVGGSTGLNGSNQPVATLPPYTVLNCTIALVGIFPSRN